MSSHEEGGVIFSLREVERFCKRSLRSLGKERREEPNTTINLGQREVAAIHVPM